MNINTEDKKLIKNAIKKAELTTSGEIVPVILSKADFYPAAHFRAALLMGVLLSVIAYHFEFFEDSLFLIWANITGLVIGYFVAFIPWVKSSLSSKREMTEEVHQRALEIFYHNHVSQTKDRTGIMIFISLLEKRVEVLADCGINEKVSKDYWDTLVQNLLARIAAKELIPGLIHAIDECGRSLSESFPIQADDVDEVSNQLITDL